MPTKQLKKTASTLCKLCVLPLLLLCQITTASEKAPGKGIIPKVSNHYKTKPSLYDLNKMPAEKIIPSVHRRFILGTRSSVTQWTLKAGTKLPLHFHHNEQITRVDKGRLVVYSQDEKYIMSAGQVMIFPPNVPHEFLALEDTVIYEVHTPLRQDFINGAFDQKIKHLH